MTLSRSLSVYLKYIRYHILRIQLLLCKWSLSILSIHFQLLLLSQQKVKNFNYIWFAKHKGFVFLNDDC